MPGTIVREIYSYNYVFENPLKILSDFYKKKMAVISDLKKELQFQWNCLLLCCSQARNLVKHYIRQSDAMMVLSLVVL